MKLKLLFLLFILALLVPDASGREVTTYSFRGRQVEAVKGELLVKFRDGVSEEQKDAVIAGRGGERLRTLRHSGVVKIRVPDHALENVMNAFNRNPDVEYAEPNSIYYAQKLPDIYNDLQELETSQWGLAKIQAPAAWEIETGTGEAVIAIIDSGVQLNHPDLAANIWINPGEISNGADTDLNGYEDDLYGWNFVNNNNNPVPTDDNEGHGTHVAGIAAASGSQNIVGVSWGNKIMSLKALSYKEGGVVGDHFDIADAIEYAADNGAHIINMSLGGPTGSQTMLDAVNYAYDAGCVLIAAAGNDGIDLLFYPAAYTNVIAVGATDINDNRAGFSNYGAGLDLMAPGKNIHSTYYGGTYATLPGTSMAAPFVSGLASLVVSFQKNKGASWDPSGIKQILIQYADALNGGGYPNRDNQTGYGRINAHTVMNFIYAGGFTVADTEPLVYPNPFNPHAEYAFMILSSGNFGTLSGFRIFSLNGRTVKEETGLSGRHAVWDGKNDDGSLCAPGLYFYTLTTYEGAKETGKVTILR